MVDPLEKIAARRRPPHVIVKYILRDYRSSINRAAVMRSAKISYTQHNTYLQILVNNGLLEREDSTPGNQKIIHHTTDKGIGCLHDYDELSDYFNESSFPVEITQEEKEKVFSMDAAESIFGGYKSLPDIAADFVRACTNPASRTNIYYELDLRPSELKRYMTLLENIGLIARVDEGPLRRGSEYYAPPKGSMYLVAYHKFMANFSVQ